MHFQAEFSALTALSQPFIACGEEKVFHYSGNALGVRDKICWVPDKRAWALKLKKQVESTADFCRQRSLCLSVNETVTGDEFTKARDKALIDACIVWNALDKSARYRIKLPAATESCHNYQLAKGENADDSAGSDSGTESDARSDE